MNFNLHTHTRFCDGKADPEAYALKAIELGFHTLGFSGHAPVPFDNHFSIKEEELEAYYIEIERISKKYQYELTVLCSLEIDYIPGITKSFLDFQKQGHLDYIIGGVHLVKNQDKNNSKLWFIDGPLQETYDKGLAMVFDSNPRKAVEAYFHQLQEMIATQNLDIIAHFDKIKMHNKDRYFSEEESWYKELVWKNLKYIQAHTDCIVEVNTRGIYKKRSDTLFPGEEILEQIHHLNIPITLSSDAHIPEELDGQYAESYALLKDIGFKELTLFEAGGSRISQSI